MAEEIALFIDFENIRYSLLNTQHREPDPQELINIARRYGTVMVAKAYADWSRQPDMFKGSLTAAMIDRVDCPAKQRDRYRSGGWQPNTNGTTPTPWNGTGRESELGSAAGTPNWASSSTNVLSINGEEEITEDANTANRLDLPEPSAAVVGLATPANGTSQPGSQSTVDLNMLMDIIETVFDRPSIQTFVLMTGDRDFTRICARLKLRLNKFVVVAGVPGTVSRDLTAAANQFVLLGNHTTYGSYPTHNTAPPLSHFIQPTTIEPTDPQFLQFLDYIDRHWAWRTIIGVSNFIGDPYNHKNRFRGRLTRESARDLLQTCIQQGILTLQTDMTGNEDLRLNRANPVVETTLASVAQQQAGTSYGGGNQFQGSNQFQPSSTGPGPYSQMGPWTNSNYTPSSPAIYGHRGIGPLLEDEVEGEDNLNDEEEGEYVGEEGEE